MTTALDPRVDELVLTTAHATIVSEIVGLLTRAKEEILTAQELAFRLRDRKPAYVDETLVEQFMSAVTGVDPYSIDGEHLYALSEALTDLASDLRQDLYSALGEPNEPERRDDAC